MPAFRHCVQLLVANSFVVKSTLRRFNDNFSGEGDSRYIMQQSQTSCTPFKSNDLWYNLSEMANVFSTLCNIHCIPKNIMAATSSSFVCGLASRRMYVLFQLMPQVLYRVNVGRLGWCLPPVNLILLQPSSCETCNMLRVVVLHETVVAFTKLIM